MRVIEECCSCEMIIGWLLFQSHHHHGRREKNETLCTYHRTQYVRSHPLVHTVQYGFYVQYAYEPTKRNNSNALDPPYILLWKDISSPLLAWRWDESSSKSKISTTTTTTLCYWNGNRDEISALSERYESVMEKRRRRQTIPGNGNDNDENDNDNDASICQSSSVSITDIFC